MLTYEEESDQLAFQIRPTQRLAQYLLAPARHARIFYFLADRPGSAHSLFVL